MTGKSIVPIIRQGGGTYRSAHLGNYLEINNEEQLKETLRQVSDSGAYPYVTDEREFEELQSTPAGRDRLFKKLITERVVEWIRLAEERLEGSGVRCFISPGNDDIFEIDGVLNASSYVENPEGKVVSMDGMHEMITLGYTNRTPWRSPREVDEGVLLERIERMAGGIKDMKNAIFNIHVPPIGTPIDEAPKVDENLKYVSRVGQVEVISAGSVSVRKTIEERQPLLGLHGHIHESRGVVMIGRTLCVNPGSEYGEGILRGFLADLEDDHLKTYLLTSG